MADGGRRKEGKPRNGGALGLFVGQRAPGRVEWRLGEADSVWSGSTADGWSGVSARESVWVACEHGEVPRGGPGGAGGFPGSTWPRSAVDEVHRQRTAGDGRKQSKPRGERWR